MPKLNRILKVNMKKDAKEKAFVRFKGKAFMDFIISYYYL